MGGDEIVAEWLGDVYSNSITATDTPQRFNATSLRFKTIKIAGYTADQRSWIGKYNSNAATFEANALYLMPLVILTLENIDLYELGCTRVGTNVDIRVLGINEY